MRYALLAAFLLVRSVPLLAGLAVQPPPPRPADECGDPAIVNQGYDTAWGKVIEAPNGDTLRIRFKRLTLGERLLDGIRTVRLVAIAAPGPDLEMGRRSQAALKQRVVGKRVMVALSPFQTADAPINALVSTSDDLLETENRAQIEAGLAHAVEQGDYDVDWWLRCELDRAEERARRAKLGLWAADAPPGDKVVAAKRAEWTILPPSEGLAQNVLVAPATGEPYWVPTVREVDEAEARLPEFLRRQGHEQHAKELSKYRRQYAGFTLEGRRLIYLSAFFADDRFDSCPAARRPACQGHDWRTEAIIVDDGGESVWQVRYDPKTKQFFGLRFNGEA